MQDDNRETEIEIKKKPKILSDWDREEIFFVRWFTFIIATVIIVSINCIFFKLDGHAGIIIFSINFLIPPLLFFRKAIWKYVKEKISYWWSMLNGRIP